jgi:hypothetical protein
MDVHEAREDDQTTAVQDLRLAWIDVFPDLDDPLRVEKDVHDLVKADRRVHHPATSKQRLQRTHLPATDT